MTPTLVAICAALMTFASATIRYPESKTRQRSCHDVNRMIDRAEPKPMRKPSINFLIVLSVPNSPITLFLIIISPKGSVNLKGL